MLPYCGRSMLELLVRDLQGREYLRWKLTGQQVATPVAIMTSDAKGNHRRISQLLESLGWMGRGSSGFRLFRWGGGPWCHWCLYCGVLGGRGGEVGSGTLGGPVCSCFGP